MGPDILILTIYFICLFYVVYQMALSLEKKLDDQVSLKLSDDLLRIGLQEQLQQLGITSITAETAENGPLGKGGFLKLSLNLGSILPLEADQEPPPNGNIMVQVTPQGPQPLVPPLSSLGIQVLNTVPGIQAFIDWDSSSLMVHTNQGQRVIRFTPGMFMDLSQPQVITVVNPGQIISTRVTTENVFGRDPETQLLQPIAPLVNYEKATNLPAPLRMYALELLIGIRATSAPEGPTLRLLAPFKFDISLLPSKPAIPLFNWMLDKRKG